MKTFLYIRYNTHPFLKRMAHWFDFIKYKLLRPIISFLVYYLRDKNRFASIHKTYRQEPLKKGISVYVPCKDEDTHILICLESLIGLVDQFILLDNGSTDNTLAEIKSFQTKYGNQVQIEVHEVPDMKLVEMVQFALTQVEYSWVLKWDGDMLAIDDDKQFTNLRAHCLKRKRPAAFTLPRLNFTGDYEHVSTFAPVVDVGEPFLRTFNNQFLFQEEFGRLEHAVIPIYYKLKLLKPYFSFHFSNLRPPKRIMYRHCYLDWRETMNVGSEKAKSTFKQFDVYQKAWFKHNFKSENEASLKFRSGRLLATYCKRFDVGTYCAFPLVITEQLKNNTDRFKIIYQSDKPYLMMDRNDPEMVNYQASQNDLDWQPDVSAFFSDKIRMNVPNEIH